MMIYMARRIDNVALRAINASMARKGITQRDLANSTLIPLSTLHRRLNGVSALTLEEYVLICHSLGLDAARLMRALENENRESLGIAS